MLHPVAAPHCADGASILAALDRVAHQGSATDIVVWHNADPWPSPDIPDEQLAIASELAVRGFVAVLVDASRSRSTAAWTATPAGALHAFGRKVAALHPPDTATSDAKPLHDVLLWRRHTCWPTAWPDRGALPLHPLSLLLDAPGRLALVD